MFYGLLFDHKFSFFCSLISILWRKEKNQNKGLLVNVRFVISWRPSNFTNQTTSNSILLKMY